MVTIREFFRKKVVLGTILFLVLLGIGFLATFNSLDPDVGWHLRTGQLILERGVPHVDWYSFSMPTFPWVDHEWFMDVLIFFGYQLGGIHLLSLVFILVFTGAFFIARDK